MDRRHALAHGHTLPRRSHGTALFADITGFTPITDALVRTYGKQRGAEETTALLDRVYGALIAEVDRHHGSVIGFSGDAITCWFDGDSGPSAITAALAMRDAAASLVDLPMVDGSPVPIAVKVTVAPGPIRRFMVGDPERQVWDVIAGSTVERLASAAGHTVSGQVVLAASEAGPIPGVTLAGGWAATDGGVWAVVGSAEPAAPSPWPELDDLALTDGQVSPWLPPAVYRHLRTGDRYLAELRPGVSVFVRFGGIDFTSDLADTTLDAFVRRVQDILALHEGTLVDVTVGDKGSYLSIVFGAPIAHEDDPARAAATALELLELPARYPDVGGIGPIRIGSARGRICAGSFGGPTRRFYGIAGREVNVAARLMEVAGPGRIVVSERVAEGSRWSIRAPAARLHRREGVGRPAGGIRARPSQRRTCPRRLTAAHTLDERPRTRRSGGRDRGPFRRPR